MKENISKQFEQFFRMFSDIVNEHCDGAWETMGHGLTTSKKLSFHILKSIKYYIKDTSSFVMQNGKTLPCDYEMDDAFDVSRKEISENIRRQKAILETWIDALAFEEKNEAYPWTGPDMESVVIFLIRHSYFHLGELSALLNEYKEGKAEDNFAKNIW